MKQIFYLIGVIVLLFSCGQNEEKKLPIYGYEYVKTDKGMDTILKPIPQIKAVDQKGDTITNNTFKDKIVILDFFFTSCPSICPVMTKNMLKIHDRIDLDDVNYLSISIDPKRDSMQKLDAYANKIGINSNEKWHFVTAPKDTVFAWARELMVVAFEDDSVPGGFEHSGYFILIDKKQRIRGFYDGTKEEEADKLIGDLRVLLGEKP